jgi:hypothetical protein
MKLLLMLNQVLQLDTRTKFYNIIMLGWRIHGGFMANGFAKVVDQSSIKSKTLDGFGYEKWLQGGGICLALL